MIRWTPQGVVAYPRAVQIRLNLNHPQRIPGKAPTPTRTLTPTELEDNLRYFTSGLDGPRSRPCTSLILSGMTESFVQYVLDRIEHLKGLGLSKLILHLDQHFIEATQQIGQTQALEVRRICSIKSISALQYLITEPHLDLELSIILNHEIIESWADVMLLLHKWRGPLINFHYPYPSREGPPSLSLERIKSCLQECQRHCTHFRIHVKGLPICYLHPLQFSYRQTGNRWYVDSDHQRENALLFLPNVLQFHKTDACRFCHVDAQCDGFFLQYLQQGQYPPLKPPSD